MAFKRIVKDFLLVLLCWAAVAGVALALQSRILPAPPKPAASESIEEFDLARVKAAIDAGEAVVLDARAAYYFDRGHLPGALSLPRAEFDFKIDALRPQIEDRTIVVYCAGVHCPDAARVAQRLRKKGFRNVAIYRGGWEEWLRSEAQ